MKTIKPSFLISILLLGLAGGYLIRSQKIAFEKKQGESAAKQVSPSRSLRNISNDTPLVAQLQSQLELTNSQEYWLKWIAGIERASVDDFPKMAQLAAKNPAALRILALRWIKLDPAHLLETLRTNSSLAPNSPERFDYVTSREFQTLLFQEWPKNDLEAAAAALSTETKLPGNRRMKLEFLNSLAEIDPIRSLETMKEWGNSVNGIRPENLTKWIERNPRAAVNAIIEKDAGSATPRLLKEAARIWSKSDPLAAMELAITTEGKLGRGFRKEAFAQWLETDMDRAADWLAEQESLQLQDELRPAVVKRWAKEDPEKALQWTNSQLLGHRRTLAIKQLFQTVSGNDRNLALQFFDQIEPGATRDAAASVIAGSFFSYEVLFAATPGVDEEGIAWLESLPPDPLDSALSTISQFWAHGHPESFKSYLLSEPGSRVSDQQLRKASHHFANNNPTSALEWSDQFPPEKQEIIAGSVLRSWFGRNPQDAINWFNENPPSDERRPALVKACFEGLSHLDPSVAAERVRLFPKEDWKNLNETNLNPAKIEKIKNLVER